MRNFIKRFRLHLLLWLENKPTIADAIGEAIKDAGTPALRYITPYEAVALVLDGKISLRTL